MRYDHENDEDFELRMMLFTTLVCGNGNSAGDLNCEPDLLDGLISLLLVFDVIARAANLANETQRMQCFRRNIHAYCDLLIPFNPS